MGQRLSRCRLAPAAGIPSTQSLPLWGNEAQSLSPGIIAALCARRGLHPSLGPCREPGLGTEPWHPCAPSPSAAPARMAGDSSSPSSSSWAAGATPSPHSCSGGDKDPVWRRPFNALPDYRQAPGRAPGSDKWGRGAGRGLRSGSGPL